MSAQRERRPDLAFCASAIVNVDTSSYPLPDLQYRAESSRATAFIGDVESCARFEEIASLKSVNVTNIWQVRIDNDAGLGKGRKEFQKTVSAVKEGTKWDEKKAQHKSNDLALLCESMVAQACRPEQWR